MSAISESEGLHARVRAVVSAFEAGRAIPEVFDELAVDLARFQARQVKGYARLCAARGVEPKAIARAMDAPATPTDAFKLANVFAFEPGDATAVFLTSGTTVGARGVHRMRTCATYDAAAYAFGRSLLARELPSRVPVLVLGPSEAETPDSSLGRMCSVFARAMGDAEPPERTFFVRSGALDLAGLRARIESLSRSLPAIVLATSFALVHLFDTLGDEVLPLPPGSRVMQTGGFKGKSREVAADALRRAVARFFAVEDRAVISEYGMTELSSQFWEATLVDPQALHGVYVEPPWARVVPVDPETLLPVAPGAAGIARIEDLANVDSSFAIVTQDRVRRTAAGFELLGRLAGAQPRGCPIALDEILSAATGTP